MKNGFFILKLVLLGILGIAVPLLLIQKAKEPTDGPVATTIQFFGAFQAQQVEWLKAVTETQKQQTKLLEQVGLVIGQRYGPNDPLDARIEELRRDIEELRKNGGAPQAGDTALLHRLRASTLENVQLQGELAGSRGKLAMAAEQAQLAEANAIQARGDASKLDQELDSVRHRLKEIIDAGHQTDALKERIRQLVNDSTALGKRMKMVQADKTELFLLMTDLCVDLGKARSKRERMDLLYRYDSLCSRMSDMGLGNFRSTHLRTGNN